MTQAGHTRGAALWNGGIGNWLGVTSGPIEALACSEDSGHAADASNKPVPAPIANDSNQDE